MAEIEAEIESRAEVKPLIIHTPGSHDQPPSPSKKAYVAYVVNITITTVALLATFIVNGFAANGGSEFGFENSTGYFSDEYHTQVTPAGWTFSIWGLIYAWQVLWLLYGWGFVIRYKTLPTIHWLVYPFYTATSLHNIAWLYFFGNNYPQGAFAFIVLTVVCLYGAVCTEAYHLYCCRPSLEESVLGLVDLWTTRILVVNGLAIYTTWVSIATLVNFAIVLEYLAELNEIDSGTTALIILAFELVIYFALENTILDRFARYVLIVYPVIVWALCGVYVENEGDGRNNIFVLVLMVVAAVLFIARIILLIIFTLFRKQAQSSKRIR